MMSSSTNYLWKKYFGVITRSKNSRIFIGAFILAIFIIGSFIFETFLSYENEIKKAEIQTSNLAQVLESQITISFRNVDLILQDIQDEIGEQAKNNKQTDKINHILKKHSSRLPEVLSLKMTDENGEYLADDRGIVSKILNLKDREYFHDFKVDPTDRLIISPPVISKTANIWIIVLVRPILSKEGQFKGMVLATIPIEYYKKMFEKVNVFDDGVIALKHANNIMFARKPAAKNTVGQEIKNNPELEKFLASKAYTTSYKYNSVVDNINRIVSARKFSKYPLYILIGFSSEAILADWKLRTTIHLIIVLLVLAMSAYFLLNFLISLEQVEEQRKQAMQSAKLSSLGEMASGIAHEINNPLTIISMSAKILMKQRADSSDEKLLEGLDKIINTSDRIAKIIRGLRSFSRDSFADSFVPTKVSKIVESTLDLCQEKIKGRGVFLKVNISDDYEINCSEIQIAQVLMNLLNNSLDALENDDERWIKIDISQTSSKVRIAVSDSGKKIPAHIAEKIMNPFFTTKEVGKGTGLGLSISKGIIDQHQGNFYLDRQHPLNTFVIELPTAKINLKSA
jgi:signal transduction histidine kinase